MEKIREWLDRVTAGSSQPLHLHEFRALMPGFVGLAVDEPTLKTEPAGFAAERPGDSHPIHVMRLRFVDTVQPTISSHAIASELGALLTLATGTKIEVALELTASVPPDPRIFFIGYSDALDRRLVNPPASHALSTIRSLLACIGSLSPVNLRALGAAARLHYASCSLVTRDFRAAYLLIVAAMEVLSRAYGNPPSEWTAVEEGEREGWNQAFIDLQLTPAQAESIRTRLLQDKHLRLKATFRSYVSSRLPDSFWDAEWIESTYSPILPSGGWHGPIEEKRSVDQVVPRDRALIHQALGKTYDVRSQLVHEGRDLGLLDVGLKAGVPVQPDEPIPYAVLRAMLVSILLEETFSRTDARASA